MTHFSYLALNAAHQRENGLLEADSEPKAREMLQAKGLIPLSLVPLEVPGDALTPDQATHPEPEEIVTSDQEASSPSFLQYSFEATDAEGDTVTGQIEAFNERVAQEALASQHQLTNITLTLESDAQDPSTKITDPARAFAKPRVSVVGSQEQGSNVSNPEPTPSSFQPDLEVSESQDPILDTPQASTDLQDSDLQDSWNASQESLIPPESQRNQTESFFVNTPQENTSLPEVEHVSDYEHFIREIRIIFGFMLASYSTYMAIALVLAVTLSGISDVRIFALNILVHPLSHLLIGGFFCVYATLTLLIRLRLYSGSALLFGGGFCLMLTLLIAAL